MSRRAIIPPGSEETSRALALSPGIVSGDHLFLTGMTGRAADGTMPADPETQFRNAFDKIAAVLAKAGLGTDSIVEMTTYHIALRSHFDLFSKVRRAYVREPFPAWTAVEVAGLRREGALVEIRVIASLSGRQCMTLRIWGRTDSSNVQALMWCVAELGLPYERIDAGHRFGVNDTPEFSP